MKTEIPPTTYADRNSLIYLEHLRGKSLREIGKEFDLSFERVRQIICGFKRGNFRHLRGGGKKKWDEPLPTRTERERHHIRHDYDKEWS